MKKEDSYFKRYDMMEACKAERFNMLSWMNILTLRMDELDDDVGTVVQAVYFKMLMWQKVQLKVEAEKEATEAPVAAE